MISATATSDFPGTANGVAVTSIGKSCVGSMPAVAVASGGGGGSGLPLLSVFGGASAA